MLLVDTHAFMWYMLGDSQISKNAINAIDQAAQSFVSSATIWEMAIKISMGKLELTVPFTQLQNEMTKADFQLLTVDFKHALKLSQLPFNHKDPFDRMIISQALSENIPVVTKDQAFQYYADLQCIW